MRLFAFLFIALSPSLAYAERSSGGKGGTPGVRANWPCPRCVTIAPTSATDVEDSRPAPVLIALHGDNGDAEQMVSPWKATAEKHGVILLSLRCPIEKGCVGASWWKWFQTPLHDPKWLGQQLDALEAAYAVDLDRVYATGFSGGSSYLGFFVPENSPRFGAVAYVSGGYPYGKTCPSCKVPTYFLIGGSDSMIEPFVKPLWRYFEACEGHEMHWEQIPNLGHVAMLGALRAGKAEGLMSWMLTHDKSCGSRAALNASASASVSASAPIVPPAPPSAEPSATPSASAPSPRNAAAPPPAIHGACGCDSPGAASTLSSVSGLVVLAALGASVLRKKR